MKTHSEPLEKPSIHSLKELFIYFRPHYAALSGILIALLFISSTVLGIGQGIRYLIDQGFGSHNGHFLDQALLILLSATLLLSLATYTRSSLVNMMCERVMASIRNDVYHHIIRVSPAFFEINKTSDVLSRLTTDTGLLNTIISNTLSFAIRNILMLIGGITLLLITSPKLTAYVLIIVPAVVAPIILLGRKVRRYSRASQDKIALIGAHAEETLAGIHTVQAYTREEREYLAFSKHVKNALFVAQQRITARATLAAIVIFSVFSSVTFVLWIGGHDVLAGRMTPGDLSSFIFYAIIVASSTGTLSEVFSNLQRAAGAADRIFELMHIPSEVQTPQKPETLSPTVKGNLTIEHVTFSYPARPDDPALSDFNLTITPGKTIALVGPSGAGKTTLFQLLLRFYDPQSGHIQLDGTNIERLDLHALRAQFGIVSQDPTIFSDTIRYNIAYGEPDATDEAIIEAAKAANAWHFIETLPDKLETFVGERGLRLSGGEKQRLAIARAILKNPRILLLDEATSALDTKNEKLVQEALEHLMQGRTTLVIAHRLSTVLKADRIVVINHGKIEEIGPHHELIKQDGLYAHLAEMQFSG